MLGYVGFENRFNIYWKQQSVCVFVFSIFAHIQFELKLMNGLFYDNRKYEYYFKHFGKELVLRFICDKLELKPLIDKILRN